MKSTLNTNNGPANMRPNNVVGAGPRICPIASCILTAALFVLLLLPVAAHASIPPANQKPTHICKLLSQKKTYKSFSKKRIKEVQKALYVTGYDANGVDGIIGPDTRNAMRRFCTDFTIETPKDLAKDYADILLHYAQIAKIYPGWKEIILDPSFGEWIEKQPVKRRAEIYKVRRSGTPGQIVFLFKRYKLDIKYGDAPLPTSRLEDPDDYMISFKLTGDDLEELKGLLVSEAIVEQIGKLQDEPYETKTAFLNALDGKIKEATDKKELTKRFKDHVLKLSEQTSAIKMTEETFKKLKAEEVPHSVIEQLTYLKDIPFANITALRNAVDEKFERITKGHETWVLTRIKKVTGAGQGPSYMLSEKFFKKMELAEVPAFLLDAMQVLKDLEFTEKPELQKELEKIIATMTGQFTDYKEYVEAINARSQVVIEFKLGKDDLEKVRIDLEAKFKGSKGVGGLFKGLYYKVKSVFYDKVSRIMTRLETVEDESFPTVAKLLKASELDAYLDDDEKLIIAKYAERPSLYMLGETTFNRLKVDELPKTILKQIKPLMGLEYPKKEDLGKAVESKIRKVSDDEKDLIFSYIIALEPAEQSTAYKLTEQFYKELEYKKLPGQLIGSLTLLKGLEFESRKELEEAVVKAINEAKEHYAAFLEFRPFIRKFSKETDIFEVTVNTYSELENDLKERIVPEIILDMLIGLKDVEYIDKDLYNNALKTKIDGLTAAYEETVLKEIERLPSAKVTEEFFTNIADGGVPEKIVEKLLGLAEVKEDEIPDKKELEKMALEMIDHATGNYEEYSPLIIMQARKRHRYKDFKNKPLLWSGGDCGCSRSDLSSVIYGFYPFWMAGKQQLDFSSLTRLGYFALPFDKDGNIWPEMHWEKEKSDFINVAHSYKAKVDLVIYNNNWSMWQSLDERKLNKLADNIVFSVTSQADNSFLNRLKPYISLGGSPVPAMGDGVTLYFDFSKTEEEDKKELSSGIIGFIEMLRKKLKDADEELFLNIMLPMSEMDGDVYSLANLKELVPALEWDEEGYAKRDIVDLFLVLLEEPSSLKKKKLRMEIEKDFKGVHRRNFLRRVVPVISPAGYKGEQMEQFEDDLIYFEDNFRGVGLWPLPVVEELSEEEGGEESGDDGNDAKGGVNLASEVNSFIIEEFHSEEDVDFLKAALLNYAPWYCNFICPNSWYFVAVLDILAALFMTYAFLSFWICELRALAKKYIFLLAGVALFVVAAFYSVVVCDPSWAEQRDELLLLLFLTGVFAVIGGAYKKMKQADMP